jgi:exodeoxyribonuclease V
MPQDKIQLTPSQKWVLYQLVQGVREKKLHEQTLGGFAGSGKTTIIKYLTKFLPNFAIAAYTGKAANILRKKGLSATTIHSRIYRPSFDGQGMFFDLAADPECDGFIIDESSMVTQEIYDDLKSYNLPIIFVGDHGQLEPIDSKLNLMQSPDYKLEEIHRYAGDIAKFADRLRNGLSSRGFRGTDNSVEFLPGKAIDNQLLAEMDQIICAFNKTRVETNSRVRNCLGFGNILNENEKIMCLRNDRKHGLFNGMQGIVKKLYQIKTKKYMDFEFDGDIIEGIRYDESNFGQETYKIKHSKDSPHPFDYAYCVTAHKAQGDEFNKVLVIEQQCRNWDHKRWAYTAASRAKEKLYWKFA